MKNYWLALVFRQILLIKLNLLLNKLIFNKNLGSIIIFYFELSSPAMDQQIP